MVLHGDPYSTPLAQSSCLHLAVHLALFNEQSHTLASGRKLIATVSDARSLGFVLDTLGGADGGGIQEIDSLLYIFSMVLFVRWLSCSQKSFLDSCTLNAAPTRVDVVVPLYQRQQQSPVDSNALVSFMQTNLCLYLLLYPLDAIPLPLQILLPQTDLVIASTDSQDVPTQTPAHPP